MSCLLNHASLLSFRKFISRLPQPHYHPRSEGGIVFSSVCLCTCLSVCLYLFGNAITSEPLEIAYNYETFRASSFPWSKMAHWRSQDFVLRGPENQAPKASRGRGMGGGITLPQPTRCLGSIVSSPRCFFRCDIIKK